MKVRRTISIDRGDLDVLKPLLDSNGNNLSHALRQLISEHRQRVNMSKITGDQQKLMVLRNQIIENRIAALIPYPLLQWLLKTNRCVPPLGTFRIIMEKYTKLFGIENFNFNDYIKLIDTHLDIFGYQYRQRIELSPDSKSVKIFFEGENTEHLKGSVINYSCLLSHHPIKLKTKGFVESPNFIVVEYEPCRSEQDAYKSVMDHFGKDQFIIDDIQGNILFWRTAVNMMRADNYNDVIIGRDIFIALLNSHEFSEHLCNMISVIYSTHIEEMDPKILAGYIEEIFRTNGLINKIELNEKEMRIFHKFDDKKIIRSINETIIKTMEAAGQKTILKKGDKMTILSWK